ncbi:hypothetical protein F3Y22_tig00111503pilonHSYRG00027 [Hibiscus syriacus]|uniref:Uncharacterized protein n=2 Tax=Hibiscus syriacus TaxID=106335 RepID=A0A6A2Y7Q2_HIBSY|nr:hypothetical protein F3Y22_tig00111503pilonHSYRG00027 [Hibiscus syriacus]
MSATALLQKAAQMGATSSTFTTSTMAPPSFVSIQTHNNNNNNNNQFIDQSSAVNNNLGMFSGIFEQNNVLLKRVDTMTVDFLGIGGSRPARNLLEKHQHHHQQHHDFDQFAGARLQGLSPFQQHEALEKPMWKV